MEQIASILEQETGLTGELVDMLVEKVYIFPDNRIEVKWKIKGFRHCETFSVNSQNHPSMI